MRRNSLEKAMKKHRKGLWSPEEDQRLKDYIFHSGIGCWSSVPINAGLQRNGKSCRLRWINYLRPGLKRGMFSTQEEETILILHSTLGNKWSQIAKHLPGRTDNEVKNYWHSYLKKRLAKSEDTKPDAESKFIDMSNTNSPDLFVNSTTEASLVELETHVREEQVPRIDIESSNLPKQDNQSFLPRLIFADWLTMEDPNRPNGPMYQPGSLKDGFSYTSENKEDFVQEFPYSEGSYSSGEFCLEAGNDVEIKGMQGMLDMPFKFEDQSTLGSGLMDLSAAGDICGGFYINNNVIRT